MSTKKELYQVEDIHKKSIDGLVIIDVSTSNPNGDPSNSGAPRMNSEGEGLISHVFAKRQIRNIIENAGDLEAVFHNVNEICGVPINGNIGVKILESHESKGKNGENLRNLAKMPVKELTEIHIDPRMFGCTILTSDNSKNGKEEVSTYGTEVKAKKEKTGKVENNITITGPIQFTPAKSICKINSGEYTLSNKTGIEEGRERGLANGGMKIVDHSIYVMKFNYRPAKGEKAFTTADDLHIFFEALPRIFNNSSLNRAGVSIVDIQVGVHNSRIGSFNIFDFYNKIMPKAKDGIVVSQSHEDYVYPDFIEATKNLNGQFFRYNI